jgi:hypothetical protein
MSEAPERIAMRWEPGAAVCAGPLMNHPDYTQWVRDDLYAAAIARAERAERLADDRKQHAVGFLREKAALAAALRTMGIDPESVVRGMKENRDG